MAKKEFKPFEWMVLYHNFNADKIEQYNILKYREDDIKKIRKKCKTKEEFSEELRSEMMYYYWSKCEWELIISKTEDNHIILTPWYGRKHETYLDVTDDNNFDWLGFANKHIKRQIYKNSAKIDVFDQLQYCWDDFLDYVWNYRFKYQRRIGE